MFIPGFLACSRLSERLEQATGFWVQRKNNQFKSGYEISRVKDAKQVARKAGNSSFRQAWNYDKYDWMVTFAWLLLLQHQRQRFLSVGLLLFHLCDWQENKQKLRHEKRVECYKGLKLEETKETKDENKHDKVVG